MNLLQIAKYFVRRTTLRQGETNFMDLIQTSKGSLIPLSEAEKEKINIEIDLKLQELQDTGLSKQQILLSKARKGLPLKIDPFFQYLKRNKLAREVYLKSEERFTVQKVVDIALRQDIGPDSSYSRVKLPQYFQAKVRAQHLDNLTEKDEKAFDPDNYYANQQFSMEKAYDQIKPFQALQHVYKPIDKYERVKKNARKLKKYDIHWRNIELLRQFVTKFGNIKGRMVNNLSTADQNKIEKAIKTARHMHAMPHYGQTPAPLRKSITSIEDEIQQIGQQHVNLQTGHIYFNRTRSMDSLQVQEERKHNIDLNFQKMQDRGTNYKIWFQNQDPLPHKPDQEILKANAFARSIKGKQLESQPKKEKKDLQNERMAKMAYRNITGMTPEDETKDFQNRHQISAQPEYKEAFSKRAERLRKQLDNNLFVFSDILLKEKTEL